MSADKLSEHIFAPNVLLASNPDKFNWVFSNLFTLSGYKPGQILLLFKVIKSIIKIIDIVVITL